MTTTCRDVSPGEFTSDSFATVIKKNTMITILERFNIALLPILVCKANYGNLVKVFNINLFGSTRKKIYRKNYHTCQESQDKR